MYLCVYVSVHTELGFLKLPPRMKCHSDLETSLCSLEVCMSRRCCPCKVVSALGGCRPLGSVSPAGSTRNSVRLPWSPLRSEGDRWQGVTFVLGGRVGWEGRSPGWGGLCELWWGEHSRVHCDVRGAHATGLSSAFGSWNLLEGGWSVLGLGEPGSFTLVRKEVVWFQSLCRTSLHAWCQCWDSGCPTGQGHLLRGSPAHSW